MFTTQGWNEWSALQSGNTEEAKMITKHLKNESVQVKGNPDYRHHWKSNNE